jgi:metal-sulfur cluster biosynthetic enzyme
MFAVTAQKMGTGAVNGSCRCGEFGVRARLEGMPTKEEVFEALKQVEDPELGMDIVELGLLYDVEVDGPRIKVIHSLTSMGCPAGPMIQEDIVRTAREVPGVEEVDIELTWDPPWTPDRMSDDAKFILGIG